jgi:hypothetical protein
MSDIITQNIERMTGHKPFNLETAPPSIQCRCTTRATATARAERWPRR